MPRVLPASRDIIRRMLMKHRFRFVKTLFLGVIALTMLAGGIAFLWQLMNGTLDLSGNATPAPSAEAPANK